MRITKRQLRKIIKEEKQKLLKELGPGRSMLGASGYSPDEDFEIYATDQASEAAYQANMIDGPKGRAAKKLFFDMMKEEVAKQKAAGVDAKKMTARMNSIWKAVYR